jgi:ribonuclease HII
MSPNFSYEKKLWRRGFRFVAGADEVGRGAFAGPIVAAAVVFPYDLQFPISDSGIKIDDSKKLKAREREKGAEWIKKNALGWGIGEVSAAMINRLGIGKATKIAFRKAITDVTRRLSSSVDFLLVDAFYVPYTKGLRRKNQKAIVHGDTKSASIAAASIIAKVYRDKLMRKLARKHRVYGWGRNKGYGTREHQEAIKKYGVTRLHRKQFIRVPN